ncbi:Dihydrolipoamide succinyltransferase component (E2) of 2-oxoglutarate dehydrogenase complex [hydrothermal vent metagenome]|uniref:dihydrolipoyllysine-residue succinyltransferase n=1 Tax=hydrothermal vent metagenome TaxID=652676 RepID=A0A3B0ZWY1_9ZZZZ
MLIDVKVPVLSESITEGTLISWHKQSGEFVRRDEVLIELETDKVVLEIVAPEDGVLVEIKKPNGATVGSAELLAIIDSEAKASLQAVRPNPIAPTEPAATIETAESSETKLSPAVRKLISDSGLIAENITGTGKERRITKADVLKHLESPPPVPSKPQAQTRVPEQLSTSREERRVPMTRLRRRIAERLKEAQNTAAMLTTFNEVNMQPVIDLRSRYKDKFEKEYGIKLGFMSFFTKAVVEGLKKFPVVNASIDGNDIVYHGYFDISIAVSSPRGLVVPVVRNADVLSFAELEHQITDYAIKAREGKLSIDDLTGGTFTVSNGGVFGSLLSTPILNPPQSGILGMHKSQIRPIVENGEIVARPMMYIALSYDHRIVDGKDAVHFLITVKEMLEDPSRLLLQI